MSDRRVQLKGRGVARDDDDGIQIGRTVSVDCRSRDFWLVK